MSKTILLADDSVTIQKVIELTFMDQDYEVMAFSNGDEALEQLDKISPKLVIADVHMPGASGYEVARRSKDRMPNVPVLLLVGTFEPFDEAEMASSGADGHLKKPFDSQELLQLVERLMASVAETREEPAAEAAPPGRPQPALEAVPAPEPVAEPSRPAVADPFLEGFDEALDLGEPSAEEEVETVYELDLDESEDISPEAVWSGMDAEPAAPVTPEASPFEAPEMAPETRWPPPPPGTEEAVELEPPEAEPAPFRLGDEEESFVLESEVSEEPAEEPAEAVGRPLAVEALGETRRAAGFAPAVEGPPPAVAEPNLPTARLSDEDVERIARRVVELLAPETIREIAWEVIPDLAEVIIKGRIQELESQVE